MSKILNQQLYSRTVYGSETANGNLRLEATSSATKGAVQVVSTALDLIIASFSARVSHSLTANRDFTLPDVSGEILVSGRFQSTGDLFYGGTTPGTAEVLYGMPGGALTTDLAGVPKWASGEAGQVLTIDPITLEPIFADVPDDPSIASGSSNSIPVYIGENNNLAPLETLGDRIFMSATNGTPKWDFLTSTYLKASTNTALDIGITGYLLTASGDGGFIWEKPNPSFIHPGPQFAIPFYSNVGLGTVVSASSFFSLSPTQRAIELRNNGKIRFFEASANGSNYLEFRAPAALGPDTVWILPDQDGASGSQLQTDGAGNLSFVDNGSVAYAAANQLAYYATAGNDVVGLPTTPSRLLLSTSSAALSWSLLTAQYFATSGGSALGNGLLDQVIVSNADGSFTWKTATDLTGEVKSGDENYLAFYPASGRAVQGNTFVKLDPTGRKLIVDAAASLSFLSSAGGSVSFLAKPTHGTNTLTFTLPEADGLLGHAFVTDGSGGLSLTEVGRGNVLPSTASGSLAFYQGQNTLAGHGQVQSLPNIQDKILLTNTSNIIEWSLLEPKHLDSSNVSSTSRLLGTDASGFSWVDPVDLTGKVRDGTVNFLAYYPETGHEVESSTFVRLDEENHTLDLLGQGTTRLFDSTDTHFVGLKAPVDLLGSTTFTVPPNDGLSGDVLITDGSGNLSFYKLETDLIGAPEDGTYTDGLFTDFTNTTKIGTVVDRFNEVLKALAPPPAPSLALISYSTANGVNGNLSFGSSNAIAGYTNVGTDIGGTALNVNSAFNVGSRVKGIYAPIAISGIVAGGASAHAYAYPASSFGDANQGTLKLEVNGSVVHSVNLASFSSGTSVNANGSGFSLSAAISVKFQDGSPLDLFKYRTGTWSVAVADQRDGWNYVSVSHQVSASLTRVTNYFEWINDAETTATSFSSGTLRNLTLTGSRYLSGVRYYTGGSALYDISFENAYRNTYNSSASAISHPTTFNCSVADASLPSTTDQTKVVQIVGKLVTIAPESQNRILGADLSVSTRVLRTVQTAATSSLTSGGWKILLDSNTPAATALVEDFEGEGYRQESSLDITSLSYGSGANSGPANWDSTEALSDGLLVYQGALQYPLQGLSGGDFRNTTDGNANGPTSPGGYDGNPNYSTMTGEKVYLRYFNTGTAKQNFILNITSTQTNFVAASNRGSLTGNNVTVEILAPNLTTNEAGTVEWKDCVTPYTIDTDIGAYGATYGASIPTNWGVTLGTKSTANSAFTVVIRITASQSWVGKISHLTLSPI